VQVQEGDLREPRDVKRAVKGVEFVLHQGAIPSVPRSLENPAATTEVNVLGTVNLLEACAGAGTVKRVVLASSSSVYGDSPSLPKVESMPLLPLSPYAASKAAMECYARAFSGSLGVQAAVLRYFNVFGPRQDPNGAYAAVIPRFFHAILRRERPVVFGDGNQTRDFTYVDNVVEANLRAATHARAAGEILNVACGERVTILGLASMIGQVLGESVSPRLEKARDGEVRHSLADIARMESVLDLRPAVDLPSGLALAADWYRSTMPGGRKRRGKRAAKK
jgi:UDP-glucose 4-epimerase